MTRLRGQVRLRSPGGRQRGGTRTAFEVFFAERLAVIAPAGLAPVIDQSDIPEQILESVQLPNFGVVRHPERPGVGCLPHQIQRQIRIAQGARIGDPESGVPAQPDIRLSGHAMQCRVTSEDPENGFIPDYGRITAYRSPAGFGVRLDAGTAYTGAFITRYYDSLLVKVTTWAPTAAECGARMHRALWEFRVRGVTTNLRFLDQVVTHPAFADGSYTTKFIDQTPELFQWPRRRDRATRLLGFIGDVIVNGNP